MVSKKCKVKGCKLESLRQRKFPNTLKDRERCLKWLAACGNPDLTIDALQYARMCDEHFEDRFKLANHLSQTAVPTLNLPEPIDVQCSVKLEIKTTETMEIMTTETHTDIHGHSSDRMEVVEEIAVPTTSGVQSQRKKASALQLFRTTKKSNLSKEEKQQYNIIVSLSKILRQIRRHKVILRERLRHAERLLKQCAFAECIEGLPEVVLNFFESHVRNMGQSKYNRKYTLNDKILALSLQKQSPRMYRYLSNIFLLPSVKTLRKLVNKINLNLGIDDFIFNNMKIAVDDFEYDERFCVLFFNEMKLSPGLQYNVKSDLIEGLVDFDFHRLNEIADHVLVWMVRGICGKKPWKQTVAYSFCNGITSWASIVRTFKAIVRKCSSIGLRVVASVCDQGPTNVRAVKKLLSNTKRRCGLTAHEGYVMVDDLKVVPLFDPLHLLKCLRNNLLTKDLCYSLDGVEKVAKWSHIEDAYYIDHSKGQFRILNKLTEQHVVFSKIKKMSVSHCAEIFSHRLASTMHLMSTIEAESVCKSRKMSTTGIDTAHFLLEINNLFDTINSKTISDQKHNISVWNRFIKMFNSMHFIKRKAGDKERPIVLANWVHTLESFKILCNYLENLELTRFKTRDFNQDPLENFFLRN